MPPPVPSRAVLRHLARLCHEPPRIQSLRSITCQSLPHPSSTRPRHFTTSSPLHSQSTAPQHTTNPESTPPSSDPPKLPDTTTYYTLFPTTLPRGPSSPFTIPLPTLRREYLNLQSQFHPDKYPTGSLAHKNALGLSALINTAYRTLSDPLLRGQYLLQLQHSIDVTSEDSSENLTDQSTLMEVMEAQEAVEEADTQEAVDGLKKENRERITVTEVEMGEGFEKGDVEAARRACVRLKYWRSLQQGLVDWEPGKEVRLIH